MTKNIEIKLFSILTDFLPKTAKGNCFQIELTANMTLHDVLVQLSLPKAQIGILVINGEKVNLKEIKKIPLSAGDKLSIFPPLAGG